MKILHSADWHTREKDLAENMKCVSFLVDRARAEQPDLIIHAGDVFDSQNVKLDSPAAKFIFETFSQLADIAPVLILIGTPSHDGKAIEIARLIRAKYQIFVSCQPEQLYFVAPDILTQPPLPDFGDCIDAVISTIPTPTKQYFQGQGSVMETDQQIGDALTGLFAGFGSMASEFGAPHIIVGHFQIGGAFVSETQQLIGRDIEVSRAQIEAANPDLVCLGHIHYPQQIGNNIYYSGSIYRKTFGETEDKGFWVHEVEYGVSEFVTVPAKNMVKFEFDFSGGVDLANIGMGIGKIKDDMTGAAVKMEVKLYEDETDLLDQELVKEKFREAGAESVDIHLIRMPRENVRSQKILTLTTLAEKITERAALVREEVPESILAKAHLLESDLPEKIIESVAI